MNDDLKSFLVQDDVVLVSKDLCHLCHFLVKPRQDIDVFGEDDSAWFGAGIHREGEVCSGLSVRPNVRAKPPVQDLDRTRTKNRRHVALYKSTTYDIGSWRAGDNGRTPGPGWRKCTAVSYTHLEGMRFSHASA